STAGCVATDNGALTVHGVIQDKDGADTVYNATITVTNVAPTAVLSNDGPVNEGSPATVSFSNASDPSPADAAALHFAFDCNGQFVDAGYANSTASASTTCTYDDNGNYTVIARVIDKDEGFTEYTTVVVVNNVAPTATLTNGGPIDEGGNVTVTF